MIDTATVVRGAKRRRALPLPVIGMVAAVVVILAAAVGVALFLSRDNGAPAASLREAQASYENGDFAAAEVAASAAVGEDGDDLDARKLLALSLSAQGKNEEAIEQYGAIVKATPKDHEALYAMATLEQLIGRASESITHLEAAVALEQDGDYLAALAPLYATVGRWDDCVKTWQQYLGVAELDEAAQAEAYAAIAGAYENAREYDKAKDALGQALFLDPNNESYKARLEAYGS